MELRRHRRQSQVNIVPLIDVLIVLLFFFLMTMQFRDERLLDITPPEIVTAGQSEPTKRIVIEIDADGKIAVAGTLVELEALTDRLRELADELGDAPVLVQADEDASVKFLTAVIDGITLAGMDADVSLMAR